MGFVWQQWFAIKKGGGYKQAKNANNIQPIFIVLYSECNTASTAMSIAFDWHCVKLAFPLLPNFGDLAFVSRTSIPIRQVHLAK